MIEPTSPDPRRDFARDVVLRLREAGHLALWAGGCVRDLLLGLEPSDYDIATDAHPEQVMRVFRRTIPVGISFGVVRVLGPKPAGEVEVATFRSDGAYLDGRRPEAVTFSSPEQDAARRDFTINGMFLDPMSGEVIDYVGGKTDLASGLLRAIGDPVARFNEDKLRILRAARFAARFGLAIEPETRSAIVAMASQIGVVAAERIAQELRKMLVHPSRSVGMRLATDLGLMSTILPTLATGEAWEEILRVLDHLPECPAFPLAFAALFQASDAVRADEAASALKLSNQERDRVAWLLSRRDALARPAELKASRLKPILAAPGIDDLLALHRAIALATYGDIDHVAYCEWYLRELPCGPVDPPPLLNGNDLRAAGLRPGPEFKRLLDAIREAQLDQTVATKEEALQLLETLIHG